MPKIEMHRDALHRLLKPIVIHTSDEKLSQTAAIRCVVVEGRGTYARAMATDRYTAAVCKTHVHHADPDFRVAIDRDDVKQLLTMFKAARHEAHLPLTLTADGLTLRVESGPAQASFALYPVENYPNVLRIFHAALSSESTQTGQAFTPALIGKLKESAAAYGKSADTVKLSLGAGPTKPALATIGEDFIAVLMPRTPNGAPVTFDELGSWANELDVVGYVREAS